MICTMFKLRRGRRQTWLLTCGTNVLMTAVSRNLFPVENSLSYLGTWACLLELVSEKGWVRRTKKTT